MKSYETSEKGEENGTLQTLYACMLHQLLYCLRTKMKLETSSRMPHHMTLHLMKQQQQQQQKEVTAVTKLTLDEAAAFMSMERWWWW